MQLKKYFISGLLICIPLFITGWVLWTVVEFMDRGLQLLPLEWQPDSLLGFHVPGLGIILSVLLIYCIGVLTTNFFGKKIVQGSEDLLERIPIVRTIYGGGKKITKAILSPDGQAFRHVWLIEYPREGLWTMAFQTGTPGQAFNSLPDAADRICVFVPTTPNPTSGFLLLVDKKSAKPLSIGVDEAMKFVLTMGVVPDSKNTNAAAPLVQQS